jgi:hypothetical protein
MCGLVQPVSSQQRAATRHPRDESSIPVRALLGWFRTFVWLAPSNTHAAGSARPCHRLELKARHLARRRYSLARRSDRCGFHGRLSRELGPLSAKGCARTGRAGRDSWSRPGGLQYVPVELEQVVRGGDQAFGAGGREVSACKRSMRRLVLSGRRPARPSTASMSRGRHRARWQALGA